MVAAVPVLSSPGVLPDQRPCRRRRHLWRCAGIVAVVQILTLLTLAASAPTAHADGSPLPLEEYWREIEHVRATITDLRGASPQSQHAGLQALAERLERITAVALPDGSVVPVNHDALSVTLRADPPDLGRSANLLDALLAARDAWPHHESPDPTALTRILARPEFQWPERQPSPLAEWLRRLRERLWEWMNRVFARGRAGGPIAFFLPGLAVLALLAALAYALRGVLTGFVSEAEADTEAESGESLTATAALTRAQMLAGAGDYRTAVRYLYLSSLLLLEERGLLRYDRSLTNREYLRSVAHKPQLAAIFRDVVEVFDRVWYGFQTLDQAQYDRYAARVDDLRHQK